MSSVPERSDIETSYKWDLESLYASDEDWEDAFERAQDRITELSAFDGRATEDAETLLETLETFEEVMRLVENVVGYARMRRDEDTRDSDYQALFARAQSLYSEASSAASFLDPEIQDCTREEIAPARRLRT